MAEVRKAAVAGSWYPGTASALADAVDHYLARASGDLPGDVVAVVAPHAGLMYSGPVAARPDVRCRRDRRAVALHRIRWRCRAASSRVRDAVRRDRGGRGHRQRAD